jgi:clan AA aspartic protease
MITGEVTPKRAAVIDLQVQNAAADAQTIRAVVDTGFTETLTIPPNVAASLSLLRVNRMPMFLAGDVQAEFDIYGAYVYWDGSLRRILFFEADGDPLVGMSLLRGFRLCLDAIDGGPVTIDKL